MQIYDAPAADLLRSQYRDPLLRHLTRTIVELARRYGPDPGALRVADIGCGVGRTSLALAEAGYRVEGVDPSERAIDVARAAAAERGLAEQATFTVGDGMAAPPDGWRERFDLAVCSEVVEHVEAPDRVVAYAHAVLRPGGILILTTPHDRRLWTVMDDYAGHVTRFTPAEIAALLEGFDVIEITTEGFPFQRLVMRAYDRMLARRGGEHAFEAYGRSTPYFVYTAVMPLLLRVDHAFRRLNRGTTLVAVAQRRDGRP